MADRLSQGFSSNDRNATRSAPATLYKPPERNARDGIAYGMARRNMIQKKQAMPTMALKTCNIGLGLGLDASFGGGAPGHAGGGHFQVPF